MTRKDFELIAQTIRSHYAARPAEREAGEELSLAFGLALEQTNDRFDLARFLRACEVQA